MTHHNGFLARFMVSNWLLFVYRNMASNYGFGEKMEKYK